MAIIGAVLGDIAGSQYEFTRMRPKDLDWKNCELFTKKCRFTDDTVLTIGTKKAILEDKESVLPTLNKNTNNNVTISEESKTTLPNIDIEKNKENKKIINQFVNYCNDGNIEEAYQMISTNCKIEKFKDINTFKKNYIEKVFKIKQEIEISRMQDASYEITYTDDALLSGGKGKNEKKDYVYIISENDGDKISINVKNSI